MLFGLDRASHEPIDHQTRTQTDCRRLAAGLTAFPCFLDNGGPGGRNMNRVIGVEA